MRRLPPLEEWLGRAPGELDEQQRSLDEGQRAALRRAFLHALEDEKRSLIERLRAGAALGCVGDPRIDPLRPSMVPVSAGCFRMGMTDEAVEQVAREFDLPAGWLSSATPQHEVDLDDFEIGRFLVTNAEWARFLADTGHPERPTHWTGPEPAGGRESHPVYGVSWEAVLAYCAWLSARTGRRYRIPTEAEWEKAARGTDGRAYPWGERFDPLCTNTRETGIGDTAPVGMFPSGVSPYGALDLAGNVEEYTASLHRAYAGSREQETAAPRERVTRGGCFGLDGDLARCDRRHSPRHGGSVGFRLARSRASAGFERERSVEDER